MPTTPAQASGEGATGDLTITSGIGIAFVNPKPSAFTIGEMVTIKADGTLIYGVNYTPDTAAELFWQAMACRAPDIFDEMLSALHGASNAFAFIKYYYPEMVVALRQIPAVANVDAAIAKAEGCRSPDTTSQSDGR